MRQDALRARFGDPASYSRGTPDPQIARPDDDSIARPGDDSAVLPWDRDGMGLNERIREQR
ncbi:MAG: hypothetical protein JO304_06210 [Solirubrobacterales bacterium]|nr:hypothetical protein [Solirubrobacterales bacterium]